MAEILNQNEITETVPEIFSLEQTVAKHSIEGTPDMVNHPPHYTNHPSGIECIQITEHMGFNLGSAVKYVWRCDLKKNAVEDLKKAVFYINREISKRERQDSSI